MKHRAPLRELMKHQRLSTPVGVRRARINGGRVRIPPGATHVTVGSVRKGDIGLVFDTDGEPLASDSSNTVDSDGESG